MKAPIKLSINPIRGSYDRRGWRRTDAHLCALAEIIVEPTSASSAGVHGFSGRC